MAGLRIKEDKDGLDLFLSDIITRTEKSARKTLKEAADLTKAAIIKNLPRSSISKEDYVHMQDDVQAGVRINKDGELYASIRGGKKTGPKWHLLNDGTYNMSATHFMDKAIAEVGPQIEAILDKEMGR